MGGMGFGLLVIELDNLTGDEAELKRQGNGKHECRVDGWMDGPVDAGEIRVGGHGSSSTS